MPLINGQKMACEPCIRGHRSTKCTHANERLMVPVRKPGRPLSTCPHPASRPCSCAQVTAAIPRKQKCNCGTKPAESASLKNENGDSSKDVTPQSPSKNTNPSYRIQKQANKSNASNSSRRQSVDPGAIERMDPNMLNVIPAYNGVQQPTTPVPDMSAFGAMGMVPAETPFGPVVYPMFPPQMPPPMISSDSSNGVSGVSNGHTTPIQNPQAQENGEPPVAKVGSCCGGGSSGSTTAPPTTQSSTAASSPDTIDEPKTRSCCSPKSNSPKTDSKPDGLPISNVPAPNGFMMAPFQTPMVMPNAMYGYYPQPTVFTYPPQYGSFLQPLQPEQWRQVMASMTFAAQGAMPAPYGISPGSIAYQPQNMTQSASGTSHQCSCGASCQCIGCAAHPYNDATQNYVRSAWQSMMDESQHSSQTNGHGPNEIVTQRESPTLQTTPVVASVEGTRSPTAPETPSDAASGMSEEQALSASDFFFVNYQFGDSCAGDTASCPCDDDCQCLGCVIHGNQEPTAENGNQSSS